MSTHNKKKTPTNEPLPANYPDDYHNVQPCTGRMPCKAPEPKEQCETGRSEN